MILLKKKNWFTLPLIGKYLASLGVVAGDVTVSTRAQVGQIQMRPVPILAPS